MRFSTIETAIFMCWSHITWRDDVCISIETKSNGIQKILLLSEQAKHYQHNKRENKISPVLDKYKRMRFRADRKFGEVGDRRFGRRIVLMHTANFNIYNQCFLVH